MRKLVQFDSNMVGNSVGRSLLKANVAPPPRSFPNMERNKLVLHDFLPMAGISTMVFLSMVIACSLARLVSKPLSLPPISSDIVVGMVIANLPFMPREIIESIAQTLDFVIDFGMMLYMFVLGLEMDPHALFRRPTIEAKVAYAGILSTFILAAAITPFLHCYRLKPQLIGATLVLASAASGTASPVLTRLITSLKIGKSDIGRLVVAAGMHTDLVASLIFCVVYVFYHERKDTKVSFSIEVIRMVSTLVIQTMFTARVSPIFMKWINNENPEGKPLKGSHLVLTIAFMVTACSYSPLFGHNSAILSALVTGIFVPREGRMSKWGVGKINYLLRTFFYPVFFFWMGLHAKLNTFEIGHWGTWEGLGVLLAITIVGKVAGTVVGGLFLGFHWPESVAVGLLLTAKGHFHVFLAMAASRDGYLTPTMGVLMVIVIFISVVYCPSVVAYIIRRARKHSPSHRMSLQLLDPTQELRILLCIHGPQNVPSAINFMEISRGPPQPGMQVHVTDMVELTDQIEETLARTQGVDAVTVTDKAVTDMRDQVTASVQEYVAENGQGITLRRMLALSTLNNMPRDICNLADELMVALIILPFHKSRNADGRTLDGGHNGFRYVNRKVLKNASCTVGILVDRGFGLVENISSSHVTLNVAVIFIGGKDDREALTYSKRVARHPGVKLTVVRFLVETRAEDTSRRAGHFRGTIAEQEEEMKLDDECFAEFYEKYVPGGRIAYVEKHLANSAETFSTLRSLEGQYSLVIVGRGGRVNSVLTVGMNDWQQCPELGPIGDILSGSDFAATTSVLVIQQHNIKGELDGLDDDFSIM